VPPLPANNLILLIHHAGTEREYLLNLLSAWEYEAEFATSASQALRKAAARVPGLILLDLASPGIKVAELRRRLRAEGQLSEIPILGLINEAERASGVPDDAGIDDCLVKPIQPAELRAKIRAILSIHPYRSLLAERAKFDWVAENALDGYMIIDDKDHIRYYNPQAARFFQITSDIPNPDPLIFKSLACRLFHCEPQASWEKWPPGLLSGQNQARYLVRPESETAPAFWLQVSVTRLPEGAGSTWLIHLRDVSPQINLQNEISQFHAMITHKLLTPQVSLLTGIELLAEHADRYSTPEIMEIAQDAWLGAKELNQSIDEILAYLRAERQEEKSACTIESLPDLFNELSALLELGTLHFHQSFELHMDGSMRISYQSLKSVLYEILENAQKFHPENTPKIDVMISCERRDCLSIKIMDDGASLSPVMLLRVGQPYFQGEKTFTGELPGLGLGLSTVARIIWSVGGRWQICNRQDNNGVSVELLLPLA
jgi:two-component system, cell cycle response regulator